MAKTNKRQPMANKINLLARLLASQRRAEVFRLLFGLSRRELYVREMERLAHLKVATVQEELRKLEGLGLVIARRDGNRLYYKADAGHPLFPEIRGLVIKTVGLVDVLRARLRGAPIAVAFVFGSVARGTETAGSDIDLFVVGDVGLREVVPLLADVSEDVFREVNPYVVSAEEFAKRVRSREHFVASVLAAEKLFVMGTDEELEALGK